MEQLNKQHLVPVYIRTTGAASAGLEALASKGALPWPEPKLPAELFEILSSQTSATQASCGQLTYELKQQSLFE